MRFISVESRSIGKKKLENCANVPAPREYRKLYFCCDFQLFFAVELGTTAACSTLLVEIRFLIMNITLPCISCLIVQIEWLVSEYSSVCPHFPA